MLGSLAATASTATAGGPADLPLAGCCDEPGWVVTFEDDFDGELNRTSWRVAHNMTHGATEKQLYLQDEVSTRNGTLVLRTRRRKAWHEGVEYNFTSGWVDGMGLNWQKYGRFEIRARLPSPAAGREGKWPIAWPAHWLMPEPSESVPPNVCWPVGGEIDIQEGFHPRGSDGRPSAPELNSVYLSYHWATECNADLWQAKNGAWPPLNDTATPVDWTAWHEYAVDWSENALTWLVDGVPRYRRASDDPMPGFFIPSTPFYMILNTALTPWADATLDGGLPIEHIIDRVRFCSRE